MASLDPISGPLGKVRAAHLLRRMTFGATRKEIDQFATKSMEEALALLLGVRPIPNPPIDPDTGLSLTAFTDDSGVRGGQTIYFISWFYAHMVNSGTNSLEKLTFFLHTHFTAVSEVIENGCDLYYQNQLLRKYALGNFKELALKICIDNAMLVMLDNRQNEDTAPNENFAREFFELYTIGKGLEIGPGNYTTYSEQDVQAAAKVLSGWDSDNKTYTTLDPETGLPTGKLKRDSALLANRHDAGTKTFSSAFQNRQIKPAVVSGDYATEASAKQELKDMVDMIFDQEATAKNICRKIYRFFVFYELPQSVEDNVITPLARTFIDSGFELKPVIQRLLSSQHFFDTDDTVWQNNISGAMIKSPLETSIGMLRFFGLKLPDMVSDYVRFHEVTRAVLESLVKQGINLYNPLDVSGYDAYFQSPGYNRNWISPTFLARRYQFAQYLIEGKFKSKDGMFVLQMDTVAFVKDSNNISDAFSAEAITKELISYLLPESISPLRYDFFLNILLDKLPLYEWPMEWTDYQTTGNDMGVRRQLNALVNSILQSAEYQLS